MPGQREGEDSGSESLEGNLSEVEEEEVAQVVGPVLKKTGSGKKEKKYYGAFEFVNTRYDIGDAVMISAGGYPDRPFVAFIKEIWQNDSQVWVRGQWMYRPEEAELISQVIPKTDDIRILYHSFHLDEVVAEAVMHKCLVHYIPSWKEVPDDLEKPGFIVQHVYDTEKKKLFGLTDRDYRPEHQNELDMLLQKSCGIWEELKDVGQPDALFMQHLTSSKANPGRTQQETELTKRKAPGGSPEERPASKSQGDTVDQSRETEAPKGEIVPPGEKEGEDPVDKLLTSYDFLTGVHHRDAWLQKILKALQPMCTAMEKGENELSLWPEKAARAVAALESAADKSLGMDTRKYHIKMRSLSLNLKSNEVLTRRLVLGELTAEDVLHFGPDELKEGRKATERPKPPPTAEPEVFEWADVTCSKCRGKRVAVTEIINTGRMDRYQLACEKCGNSWYAGTDSVSRLSEAPPVDAVQDTGMGTSATEKFGKVEQEMAKEDEEEKKKESVVEKEAEGIKDVDAVRSVGSDERGTESGGGQSRDGIEAPREVLAERVVVDEVPPYLLDSNAPGNMGVAPQTNTGGQTAVP